MSNTARRREIDDWFERALDHPTQERTAWVDAECTDPELRAEVHALLAAHDQASGILDRDAVSPAVSLLGDPMRGRRVGAYRLLRELGRGGMGVVYLAERDDGHFRRRAALKLLRGGPDAEELRRRFVAERQILASLSHPNIAGLLDGGVTDGQLPYLVMEYVDGLPITTYCDRHKLGLDDRLRLFQRVCAAVHHAHQNLVLHRDLKPGNIMVAADGTAKLLDFGIAKLLNPTLGMEQPLTRTDLRVLTPEYSSPEQVRGESLTTTSDVFALGVVLYELVCGGRPFRVKGGSFQEVCRLVCELEPERPSVRVAGGSRTAVAGEPDDDRVEVAAARGTTPERLARELRGDLDAIVLFALRKEPGRRYGSAELLAQDIERFLAGAPVLANKGSTFYRVRRVCSRHRKSVATVVVVLLAILGGAGVAVRQAAVARAERDRAEALRTQSQDVTRFLLSLFEGTNPAQVRSDSLTAGELLRRGVERIERLKDQPLVQASLLETSAQVYTNMARYEPAAELMERAVALRERHQGSGHPDLAATLYEFAEVRRFQGQVLEAHRLSRQAHTIRRAALGSEHPDVATSLLQLSRLSVYLSDLAASESLAREGLEIRRRAFGPHHALVGQAYEQISGIANKRGKLRESEEQLRSALAIYERSQGPNGESVCFILLRLADMADDRGDHAGAEALRRRVLTAVRARGGEEEPQYAHVLGDLSTSMVWRGDYAAAESLARQSLAVLKRIYGPAHPSTALGLSYLAFKLEAGGKLAEAESLEREAAEIWERTLGPMHANRQAVLMDVGQNIARQGRLTEAESLFQSVLSTVRDTKGDSSTAGFGLALARLGALRIRQGRRTEADSLMRLGRSILLRHTTDEQRDVRGISAMLANLHAEMGHADLAEYWRRLAKGARPLYDMSPPKR